MCVISGFCDQASYTTPGVRQSPMSWIWGRGAPRMEGFLLGVSGNSRGRIRTVSVAVPKDGRSPNMVIRRPEIQVCPSSLLAYRFSWVLKGKGELEKVMWVPLEGKVGQTPTISPLQHEAASPCACEASYCEAGSIETSLGIAAGENSAAMQTQGEVLNTSTTVST